VKGQSCWDLLIQRYFINCNVVDTISNFFLNEGASSRDITVNGGDIQKQSNRFCIKELETAVRMQV
jgi:hypothetical protein